MMGQSPDILVLGLGPAGACAARAAAEENCAVLAVERKKSPGAPVQCAEFVPAMLGSEVRDLNGARIQPITAMLTQVESQAPDLMADFPGQMIDRERFDAALAQEAEAAGAECLCGQAVRAIDARGAVTLADGTRLCPRVIIGADGPRSLAGKAIGAVNSDVLETRQITVPLLKPFESTDIFLSAGIRGGYGWLFPKGEVANLGLGVMAADKARLKPLLNSLHQKLADEGRVGRKILCHTGGAIPAGGMVGPHGMLGKTLVLLAGDAAGLTNPVTGAGINAAVQSGTMAGEAAADWLAGDASAPDNYAQDLDDVFGASLRRALARRHELMRAYANENTPSPAQMRAGWIAYSEYWAA